MRNRIAPGRKRGEDARSPHQPGKRRFLTFPLEGMGSDQILMNSTDDPRRLVPEVKPIHLVNNALVIERTRIEGMKRTVRLPIMLCKNLLKKHQKRLLIHKNTPTL
jgi:hypothetical protein